MPAAEPPARSEAAETRPPAALALARCRWPCGCFLLVAGAVALYFLAPQILAVFASAPQLSRVDWPWLAVMFGLETASFAAAWGLARLAVPGAAAGRWRPRRRWRPTPPAGPCRGGWWWGGRSTSACCAAPGVDATGAAAALTANSLISNMVLFALPAAGAVSAAVAAAVPRGLLPVALAGLVLFLLTLGIGAALVRFDWPLATAGVLAEWLSRLLPHWLFRGRVVRRDSLLRTRDELVAAMGGRWWQAVGFAAANWMLDYLVLVAALRAIGAEPAHQPGAAGLRGGLGAGHDPAHPGRPGVRGGRPGGHPDRVGHRRRRRPAGHPGLPPLLVLAADPRRGSGLPGAPPLAPGPARPRRAAL